MCHVPGGGVTAGAPQRLALPPALPGIVLAQAEPTAALRPHKRADGEAAARPAE